eukprot:COSAG05_NODE_2217_length_3376_cov_61.717410_5_plen_76_part_00
MILRKFAFDRCFEPAGIVEDEEVKRIAAAANPYGDWLSRQVLNLSDIAGPAPAKPADSPVRYANPTAPHIYSGCP